MQYACRQTPKLDDGVVLAFSSSAKRSSISVQGRDHVAVAASSTLGKFAVPFEVGTL